MIQEGLAVVYVDNSGGTPVNITTSLESYEGPDTERQSSNYYTMDTLEAKVSLGGKVGGLTLTVLEEPGNSTPHALMLDWHENDDGTARTITQNVPDEDTGSTRYAAEYKPTGRVTYSRGRAGSTNPRLSTFTFTREGALVKTTIA